jgi:hypothetical protein
LLEREKGKPSQNFAKQFALAIVFFATQTMKPSTKNRNIALMNAIKKASEGQKDRQKNN